MQNHLLRDKTNCSDFWTLFSQHFHGVSFIFSHENLLWAPFALNLDSIEAHGG